MEHFELNIQKKSSRVWVKQNGIGMRILCSHQGFKKNWKE